MSGRQIAILAILVGYMVINAFVGVWISRASARKNSSSGFIQNYFVGGRTMGG